MMRAGPRMMCSPYLTGSLAIMLVIVTFNYWTVSTENSDLGKKIQEMTHQLKSGSVHINSLETEIRQCRESGKEQKKQLGKLKEESESKYHDLEKKKDKLVKQLSDMSVIKKEKEEEEQKFSEDAERQRETVDTLRDEIESLKLDISNLKLNISSCGAELAAERADRLIVPPDNTDNRHSHKQSSPALGPGQLPDLNPDAVNVVRKETQGMKFHKDKAGHWLPIIVQGDPRKPRAKPSVSVMDIVAPSSVDRVKKNALLGAGGAGLRIEEAASPVNQIVVPRGSSSRPPPPSSSTKATNDNNNNDSVVAGVVPAPKIVVNEGAVMPLPQNLENLDKAEDDSNVAHEEESEDDQDPDGQIGDSAGGVINQQYLKVEDGNDDEDDNVEPKDPEASDEEVIDEGEEKLENLKESLNQQEHNNGDNQA